MSIMTTLGLTYKYIFQIKFKSTFLNYREFGENKLNESEIHLTFFFFFFNSDQLVSYKVEIENIKTLQLVHCATEISFIQ